MVSDSDGLVWRLGTRSSLLNAVLAGIVFPALFRCFTVQQQQQQQHRHVCADKPDGSKTESKARTVLTLDARWQKNYTVLT